MRASRFGNFSGSYQFLQSDVRSTTRPVTSLHNATWNWSKSITKTTTLSAGGNGAHTGADQFSQENTTLPVPSLQVDQSRVGVNTAVTQILGKLNLSVNGSRTWFRNRISKNQNN